MRLDLCIFTLERKHPYADRYSRLNLRCSPLPMYKTHSVMRCKRQLVPNGVSPFVFPPGPCAPMNVSASLVCDNNTAAVSWQHSSGAVSYKVLANGRDGDVKECTTNGTSCLLPNMHCAETYVIMVTPFSEYCKGFNSYPHSYIAGEGELEKKFTFKDSDLKSILGLS